MQIRSILHHKGSGVATIAREATVLDSTSELARLGVGALVVSPDGGAIDGIVSERDVARAIAEYGAAALDMTVGTIMTSDVKTCGPDDTVDTLMELMTNERIRHVPVVSDGHLTGIISIGDVVKHRLSELQAEAQTLHDYIISGR